MNEKMYYFTSNMEILKMDFKD